MDKKVLELYIQLNKIQNQFTAVKRLLIATDFDEPIYAAEMQVLVILHMQPNYTVSDIAKALYITNSGASQLVKKLTLKGYLKKARNIENERITLISLTELGQKAVDAFLSNEVYMFGDIVKKFENFTENQMKTVKVFLDALEELFEKKLE